MEDTLKAILGFLATIFIYLLGGFDVAIQSLLIAMVIDYLTGLGKGYVKAKLDSDIGFKGIIKKFAMLGMVAVSVILDKVVGDTGLIRTMVIYYLVANECLSILENLGEMNIVVPKVLKSKLEQLRKSSEGGNDE